VALFVVLVVTAAGAVQRSGRDDVVAEPAQRSTTAPSAPAPAPLTLSVTLPAPVVAGQPAEITVRYADGDGRFGGSTEEWGDGVGGASAKQGPCAAGAGFGPLEGSYTATHTWTRPGTYTVAIGVSSYTCTGTAAVVEQASRSVAVRVTAP
jgi:hypothetical protein